MTVCKGMIQDTEEVQAGYQWQKDMVVSQISQATSLDKPN